MRYDCTSNSNLKTSLGLLASEKIIFRDANFEIHVFEMKKKFAFSKLRKMHAFEMKNNSRFRIEEKFALIKKNLRI